MTNHKAIRALTEAVDFLMDKQEFDAAEIVSSLIDELMTDVKLSGIKLSELSATDVSHYLSITKRDDESYEKRMQSPAQSV